MTSVYARHIPELRVVAEPILREILEEDTEMRWLQGKNQGGKAKVQVKELVEGEVEEWTDGSMMEGRAAGATREKSLYLGEWATVADAEEVGVMLYSMGRGEGCGSARQPGGHTANPAPAVRETTIIDRRETGSKDARETTHVNVGQGTQWSRRK